MAVRGPFFPESCGFFGLRVTIHSAHEFLESLDGIRHVHSILAISQPAKIRPGTRAFPAKHGQGRDLPTHCAAFEPTICLKKVAVVSSLNPTDLIASWSEELGRAEGMQTQSIEVSDEQLLRQIADGDQSAFAAFFDRCAPRVKGVAVTMLGLSTDADDLVQDVFCQVWTSAGKYDRNRGNPLAWVTMIARSRAIDSLRKRRKTAGNVELSEAEEVPDELPGPNDQAARTETDRRIHSAMASLPEEQSRLIALSFLSGLNHEEIAAKLNLPLGTVKTRIRRGIMQMRSTLGVSVSVTND